MRSLAVDIGNTSTKVAMLDRQTVLKSLVVPTVALPGADCELYAWIRRWAPEVDGVAYCSVVPEMADWFEEHVAPLDLPLFNLNHETVVGLPIVYPCPPEIGQDRLANAVGGKFLKGAPLVVIDFGTAVTFDILNPGGAYIGGVIVPGLTMMVDYLHEKTALLPRVDPRARVSVPAVGKSTVAAIRSGYTYGFDGMIRSILGAVTREIEETEKTGAPLPVLVTGGSVPWLEGSWIAELPSEPNLTLIGLAVSLEMMTREA